MSSPSLILDEPLTLGEESIPRRGRCSGAFVAISLWSVGLVCLLFSYGQHQAIQEPAISMIGAPSSMSCPRSGPLMSVNAMEEALGKYGIPITPLARFALTSYAATRDVSMKAQVKEEFARLDPATQTKLKKLEKQVVVRASMMKGNELAGATKPLGFFDPAKFSSKWEERAGGPAVLRSAELKHGRVCMLATLGIFVTEKGYHPIFDAWGDGEFVSAAQTHFTKTTPENFWVEFWLLTGFIEWATHPSAEDLVNSAIPGDLGWDPLNLKATMTKTPEALKTMQEKELNNGRLAMVAAAGILAQELVTGKKIF